MERRDTHASELTVRIRTGALLTLILLGAFQARQVPGILEGLSTLLGLLGCFELLRAMGLLQGRWGWLVYAGTALCCLLFPLYIPRLPIPMLAAAEGAAAAAGLLSLLLSGCGPFPRPPYIRGLLGGAAIGASFACLPLLGDSLFTLVLPFAACVLTDAAAYFGGKALGKKQLAPLISPHKTVAGSLCGTLAATVLLWLVGFLLQAWLHRPVYVSRLSLYGYTASLLGQLGDLVFFRSSAGGGSRTTAACFPAMGGCWTGSTALCSCSPIRWYFFGICRCCKTYTASNALRPGKQAGGIFCFSPVSPARVQGAAVFGYGFCLSHVPGVGTRRSGGLSGSGAGALPLAEPKTAGLAGEARWGGGTPPAAPPSRLRRNPRSHTKKRLSDEALF